jgi:hypothetical protein
MEGRRMNLLLIVTKLWKYKFVTIPIIAFVFAGAYYVVAVKAPTYETSASYILVNPPPAPTDADIARDPALGRVHADNPYTRFSDGGSVLVQVLTSRLSSDLTRQMLVKEGADPGYMAAPSVAFGFGVPLLEITGRGTTAAEAVKTANIVGQALSEELDRMQVGVDRTYRITAQDVVPAHDAKLKPSGKLRSLVAVLVLGTIMLFIAVSVLDAISALRAQWSQGRLGEEGEGSGPGLGSAVPLHPSSPARGPDDELSWDLRVPSSSAHRSGGRWRREAQR